MLLSQLVCLMIMLLRHLFILARVWLQRALDELNRSLVEIYDSRLILRHGSNALGILTDLAQETGAKTVVWTALYEPWVAARDHEVEAKLNGRGIKVYVEHSYLLHRPDEVVVSELTKGASHHSVCLFQILFNNSSPVFVGIGSVTHFMECCRRGTGLRTPIGTPVEPPVIMRKPAVWPKSCSLASLNLYVPPVKRNGQVVDWAKDIHSSWSFSEDGAFKGEVKSCY